jgi:hypothetical protein
LCFLSSSLKMDVLFLFPSSREEGHNDNIYPESPVAASAEPPVPEDNLKSEEEHKAWRKLPTIEELKETSSLNI